MLGFAGEEVESAEVGLDGGHHPAVREEAGQRGLDPTLNHRHGVYVQHHVVPHAAQLPPHVVVHLPHGVVEALRHGVL